jgi:hypothetical protein
VSARIRVGSGFKRSVCFVLIDVKCFRVRPKRCLRVPHVEERALVCTIRLYILVTIWSDLAPRSMGKGDVNCIIVTITGT